MDFNMDQSLGFILNRTAAKVKGEFAKRLRPFGLTPEQWSVLNRLWEEDGLTQKELSARTFKDQPNTARILDKLGSKGLVKRADNPGDRRAFLVYLTDEGRSLREEIVPFAEGLNEDAGRGLNPEERERLLEMLNRIYSNLD